MMVTSNLMLLQLSLHKEPSEVGLVKKLTGSLYWWVEQCVPTLNRECDIYTDKPDYITLLACASG